MKKILFLIAIALCSMLSFAQTIGGQQIELKPVVTKPTRPRPAQITPKVYLSQFYTQISVQFYAPSDSYDLIVEDQGGGIVCQWALMTDGAFYFYSLPDGLSQGEFTVRIESADQYYEGDFYLP